MYELNWCCLRDILLNSLIILLIFLSIEIQNIEFVSFVEAQGRKTDSSIISIILEHVTVK